MVRYAYIVIMNSKWPDGTEMSTVMNTFKRLKSAIKHTDDLFQGIALRNEEINEGDDLFYNDFSRGVSNGYEYVRQSSFKWDDNENIGYTTFYVSKYRLY